MSFLFCLLYKLFKLINFTVFLTSLTKLPNFCHICQSISCLSPDTSDTNQPHLCYSCIHNTCFSFNRISIKFLFFHNWLVVKFILSDGIKNRKNLKLSLKKFFNLHNNIHSRPLLCFFRCTCDMWSKNHIFQISKFRIRIWFVLKNI